MLRLALTATALAAASAVHAAPISIDYRVDYQRAFEHLTATTTDLSGQSATGRITFDTANLLASTSDGISQTLVYASDTTLAPYSPFPVPPSNTGDTLTFTFFLTGALAGTVSVQSGVAIAWTTPPGQDHERAQTLNFGSTFGALNPAAPTTAELVSVLQGAAGTPGAAFGLYRLSSLDTGTISYTDLLGTATVVNVSAIPEADTLSLSVAGLACVVSLARRRRAAEADGPRRRRLALLA